VYVKSCADLQGLCKLNVPGDGDCGPHSLRVLALAAGGRLINVKDCRKLLVDSMATISPEFKNVYAAQVAQEQPARYIAGEEVGIALKSGLFISAPVNVMILEEFTTNYGNRNTTAVPTGKRIRGNVVYNSANNNQWVFVCMTGSTKYQSSQHFELLCRPQQVQGVRKADTALQFILFKMTLLCRAYSHVD
jgi:hypothetical protein